MLVIYVLVVNNKLTLMYGKTASVGYDTTITTTFPKAFTSKILHIYLTRYNTAAYDKMIEYITSQSITSFTASVCRVENKADGTRYLKYLAIGI